MLKKIILFLLPGILIFAGIKIYHRYQWKQEEARRATFYENLEESASPTVTVLRDSILIDYQQEKRTVHIYVPPSYAQDSLTRYPVMYFMDGESAFNDMENQGPEWQIDNVIDAAAQAGEPTAIVVAINQAEDRDAEYTPWVNEDNPNAHGEAYIEWVATDLKPWIDANYRTQSEATATSIGGISRSGMMAYYALMAKPDIFGRALIQSPAMWVDEDRLMEMELTDEQLQNKKIFVSVGENEGMVMVPAARKIFEKFQEKGLGEDQLKLKIIPNEGHWHITWRKSFAVAYPWLMG